MKKIIICSVLLAFTATSFGQQSTTHQTDYLKKSRNQKTVAWVLLGSCIILETTTFIIAINDIEYGSDVSRTTLLVMGFAGGAAMLGSIPLFIASGKNKRKAKQASVFINMEKMPVLQGTLISNQSFPAIGMKISIQ